MTTLAHRLDRTLVIEAPQAAVFKYFTDPARWAAWWGAGSTIDARPGGRVYVRHPGNVEASGEVVAITPPSRIVFTYGFDKGQPFGPGESRVTIDLERLPRGTRLRLVHDFPDSVSRDHHEQGWRYQLSLFANVVTDESHADANALADRWFAAWAEPDAAARTAALEAIASAGIRMRDRFSSIEGVEELTLHLGAAQRFMPGLRLQRSGDTRHCQGTVLADWTAQGADGERKGHGTNALDADGRIESVTGLWAQP
jgi:uncharacterized protein YndB with AHSA1/START domain